MVLAYYGESRTEAELCGLLRCTAAGTKAANVRLVSALGYDVDVNYLGVEHAREHLAHGTPIIACVRTGDLE
ncbi:MAG: hypothetical protein AUJ92_13740 [Armatimonadetes bacterium CG2_30_59_28]|nr:MAG: hypothetical protein AUJ92_13740 [Armatimonadetes bacterium CG2_30_59_28]PIU66820.1 MAG: hypothetical protein COS85_03145 [Armatimonadetes bacterium CG07_land_8_20_14_0_80_59_28]PJB67548.1 MAG: hypothetical protein CO095_12045 [Armatimonadetes bacterium CG_4_9_14_3_um_filter_58_7]